MRMRDCDAFAMLGLEVEESTMTTVRSATTRCLSVLLIASLVAAGCSRTYIYGPERMPEMTQRTLQVRSLANSHGPIESFEIERIGLRHLAQPGLLRAPTNAEYNALINQSPLDVYTIEIDVDASTVHWRDYGLGGVGIGMTAALVSNLSDEGGLFQDGNGMALLGSITVGFVGFLTGLIVGSLAAPDVIDTRFSESSAQN